MSYHFSILLLLSCIGIMPSIKTEEDMPLVPEVSVVQDAAPVAEETHVIATPTESIESQTEVVEPVVESAPVVTPPVVQVSAGIPTEADITKVSKLIAHYKAHVNAINTVHQASLLNIDGEVADEELVRSLLNLLLVHKKEEALIDHLRGSIASLKEMLNSWEDNVEALLKEKSFLTLHHHNIKPHHIKKQNKKDKRDIDYQIVKDQSSKPRPQK